MDVFWYPALFFSLSFFFFSFFLFNSTRMNTSFLDGGGKKKKKKKILKAILGSRLASSRRLVRVDFENSSESIYRNFVEYIILFNDW